MNPYRLVPLSLLVLIVFNLMGCGSPPPPPPSKIPVVLVFCDVTNSLLPEEGKEVALYAAAVLDRLPPRSEFSLYPIQMETQRPPAIKQGTIPIRVSEKERQDYDMKSAEREKETKETIDALYAKVNQIGNDNRTCILNTLAFADNYFKQYDPAKYTFEIIFISDMIEECDSTQLPVNPVKLNKHNILREVDQARSFPAGLDLTSARITVILPTAEVTISASQKRRPDIEQLKQFWLNVLNKCGFEERTFAQNTQHLSWSIGLPGRFRGER